MIWRIIAFWLASLTFAFADLPRHGARVETNETRFVYDGMLVVQERDTNNNVLVAYTRGLDVSLTLGQAGGIGGLLARTDANGSTYYHADGNGNITALIDGNENVVTRYEYDGFARSIGQWGTMANSNRYRFSSKEYVASAGIYYYGYRFYDSSLQRWLSRDPIAEAGGLNLYRFEWNSPINFVDPRGLDALDDAYADMGGGEDPAVENQAFGQALNDTIIQTGEGLAAIAIGTTVSIGTAGLGAALLPEGAASGLAVAAASGITGDAANQDVNLAFGNQENFNFGELATSGLTAGLIGAAADCSIATETTAADSPMITVLGSGRDVAPYVGQPGFNTFTGAGIPAAELDTQNALWLNNAVQRGDQIWLVTDPAAHQALMNQLNLQSAYLNLELPMLGEYSGVNAIPKFAPPPTAVVP